MMSHCFKLAVAFALTAAIGAPQGVATKQGGLAIRSIKIIPVPTSRAGLPDPGTKVQDALASVPLTVESKLDGPTLLSAIDKAEKSIQSVYKGLGKSVRVEHELEQIPPRSLELRFRVIELCSCDR